MAHTLLVHDHPAIRHAVKGYLERSGHAVTTAPTARAAVELAGPEIDVVVTDIERPGTGGVDLIHALRERNLLAPVILLSGRSPHAEEAATAAFVLLKPFGPDELDDAIKAVLGDSTKLDTVAS